MSRDVVLVTGGSRGIGRAVVELLAGSGAAVGFTFCSQEAAARKLEEAHQGRVCAFQLDLQDRGGADHLVSQVEETLGPLTGLVNNAGIRREALLPMTPDNDWDAVLETNLGGTFRVCRAVLPGMVRRHGGSIVNVASLIAFHGVPGQTAYAASKAGILGMTRSLAREIGKRNIRVNAVVPGFVVTDMTSGLAQQKVDALRSTECLPGGVSAESVAEAVFFLLSDKASAITGQSLVVDAGCSA